MQLTNFVPKKKIVFVDSEFVKTYDELVIGRKSSQSFSYSYHFGGQCGHWGDD